MSLIFTTNDINYLQVSLLVIYLSL